MARIFFGQQTKRWIAAVFVAVLVATLAPAADAAPRGRGFGVAIDEYSGYDGQDRCSPWAKPGTIAFQQLVVNAYPGTSAGSISRACTVGGTSEHKEGRAWDWPMNASSARDRAVVDDLMDWLEAPDRFGNDAAMARRLGVMYVIWNRKIWGPGWGDWRTYCAQRRRGCVDPEDGDLRSPHTDHVHFSLTSKGAWMKTTYWNKKRSFVSGATASPWGGLWMVGRNGAAIPRGTSSYGSKAAGYLPEPMVSMAATPSGAGYWMLAGNGRLFAFGDAKHRGGVYGETNKAAVVAANPNADIGGYWIAARGGRVFAFGESKDLGGVGGRTKSPIVALVPTSTGDGYWLAARNGRVHAFGDAAKLGDAAGKELSSPVVGMARSAEDGYWLVTAGGRVLSFGPARGLVDDSKSAPGAPLADIVATADGLGYWLVNQKGALRAYGAARSLPATTRS